jgi:hypothetical protein
MTGFAAILATEVAAVLVRPATATIPPIATREMCSPRISTYRRDRERRRERHRVYEIDGTESRMLATVGAFRVVSESDLHEGREDTRKALRHLEREWLLHTTRLSSEDRAVVLADRARDLLEANRHERHQCAWEPRQTFYAGLKSRSS